MYTVFIRATFFLLPLAGFLAHFAGCGYNTETPAPVDGPILATVGGKPITLSEYQTFAKPIPEGMKKGKTPLAKERQVLESLIDKHLLLL